MRTLLLLSITGLLLAGSVVCEAQITFTEYPFPAGTFPSGITSGPDGNLWFTELVPNKVGRITPTGVITEFSIPTVSSAPIWITAGPDGNLWFTEELGNKIGRITPSGVITEFLIPTNSSFPAFIAAGPDGNVWFTEGSGPGGPRVGRITPSGVITEFPIPTGGLSSLRGIAAGPDGNLWFTVFRFTGWVGNKIGRITPT